MHAVSYALPLQRHNDATALCTFSALLLVHRVPAKALRCTTAAKRAGGLKDAVAHGGLMFRLSCAQAKTAKQYSFVCKDGWLLVV